MSSSNVSTLGGYQIDPSRNLTREAIEDGEIEIGGRLPATPTRSRT